ncbi:hypothetical protein BC834DRAFT_183245 [Gloeopeniophorella convolvens]|nr:hypothetical protein BC834DRAFT_183245 [Gloeopeniophorella convolvens]
MVAPSRLLSLPVELLAHIILLLHETPRDVLACQLTCRKLFHVVCSSVILQYVLRARRAGVVDPLLSGMSTYERACALLRWEMPWLLPDLRQPAYSMPQPWADDSEPPELGRGPETPKYFIQRGRLVSVISYSPFKYAVLDLRVPPSSLSNSWSLVTIPAFHDDEKYWDEFFFQGYEFSFDSDLLVLTHLLGVRDDEIISGSEVEMKLFSISRGEPHASAPIHTFNIPADAIHGEYVGVATAVVRDCILVNIVSDPDPATQSHAVAWKGGLVSEASTAQFIRFLWAASSVNNRECIAKRTTIHRVLNRLKGT